MPRPRKKNQINDLTQVISKLKPDVNRMIERYAAKYKLTKGEAVSQILMKIVEKHNQRKEAKNVKVS